MSTDLQQEWARGEFTELWSGCAPWLHKYLISLLYRPADAEEVLQQTSIACWENFDRYQPNTEFRAWACRVAYFKAIKFRQSRRKAPPVFSDLFIEAVDEEAILMADQLDQRLEGLKECLAKLPAADRELVQLRYGQDVQVAAVAESCGRSVHAVYRGLARIREVLRQCITRSMQREAAR